jgi:hypothetical protein
MPATGDAPSWGNGSKAIFDGRRPSVNHMQANVRRHTAAREQQILK